MRKNIVIANWKMNTNVDEGIILLDEIMQLLTEAELNDTEVVICPPATHLYPLDALLVDYEKYELELYLGAQDCSTNKGGAFTGDLSAEQLAFAGASFVIIGHSERRNYQAETNVMLINKIDEALASVLNIVFCIGESETQRTAGQQYDVIEQQLNIVLQAYKAKEFESFIIAYEPVWAVGTGNTATPEQAQEMHAYIRQLIEKKYGKTIANQTQIVYGGSCNSQNCAAIFSQSDIDGGLIGSASLLSEEFLQIVSIASKVD